MAKYEVVIPLKIEERAERCAWGAASSVSEVVKRMVAEGALASVVAGLGGVEVGDATYQRSDDEAIHDRARDRMERDYHADVRGVADDFAEAAKGGEFADDDDASTWLHETIDGHRRVFVTALAQECLRFSPNDGAYIDEFGAEGAASDGGLNWSALAFSAFEADIREELSSRDIDPSDPNTWPLDVSSLPRAVCVHLLTEVAIECSDDESIEDLREAVAENVKDGTIDRSEVLASAD